MKFELYLKVVMPLVIKDFEKQRTISIEQIVSIIDILPTNHIQGLTHIVYDPTGFYRRSYVQPQINSTNILGEYQTLPTKYICINKFKDLEEFKHVLMHEIGHHVYQRFLKPNQRRNWLQLHRQVGRYVSDYAKTNAEEDFAESYASFWLENVRIERIASKKRFLRSLAV